MLDRYTCECMVSIINIINGIKEPTSWCSTSKILIFGRYVKVRESCIPVLLFGSIPL